MTNPYSPQLVFSKLVPSPQHDLGNAGVHVFVPEDADRRKRNESLRANKEAKAIGRKEDRPRCELLLSVALIQAAKSQ
jgi:hypothetical protein